MERNLHIFLSRTFFASLQKLHCTNVLDSSNSDCFFGSSRRRSWYVLIIKIAVSTNLSSKIRRGFVLNEKWYLYASSNCQSEGKRLVMESNLHTSKMAKVVNQSTFLPWYYMSNILRAYNHNMSFVWNMNYLTIFDIFPCRESH